jgi:hypothetical protein
MVCWLPVMRLVVIIRSYSSFTSFLQNTHFPRSTVHSRYGFMPSNQNLFLVYCFEACARAYLWPLSQSYLDILKGGWSSKVAIATESPFKHQETQSFKQKYVPGIDKQSTTRCPTLIRFGPLGDGPANPISSLQICATEISRLGQIANSASGRGFIAVKLHPPRGAVRTEAPVWCPVIYMGYPRWRRNAVKFDPSVRAHIQFKELRCCTSETLK